MEIGIVGLPNVGKSTLFNALTRAGAASSNYPFTTIDPNVGVVPVPDKRLDALFAIERQFGRRREYHHAPRTLDLDLLLYDDLVVESQGLVVPHPRMHLRAFVIAPLLELAPQAAIPGRGQAVAWLPAVSMQRIERLTEQDHGASILAPT